MNFVITLSSKFCKGIAICLIRFYKIFVSPILHCSCLGFCCQCRYKPTCSVYALQCFKKYGFLKAFWLTLRRLGRCNPWSSHPEEDPVP